MLSPPLFLPSSNGGDSSDAIEIVVVSSLDFTLLEHVPESKRLIACARDNRLAVGRERQVQHSVGVALEDRDLLHRRILPHKDLVLRVSVRRHKLVRCL